MKLCVIEGTNSTIDAKTAIMEEGKKYFDIVSFVPLKKIRISCHKGKTELIFKNKNLLEEYDAIYFRIFSNDFTFGEIVLDIVANHPVVYTPNSAEAFQVANHKYYTTKVLNDEGIYVPLTTLASSPQGAMQVTDKLGFPIVIKLLSGFGGKGVMLCQSKEELLPILDTMQVLHEFVSSQSFVENNGSDFRCYVIGEQVISIQRKSKKGEWRANVSRGGSAKFVKVPEEMKQTALKAAKIMGLEICAVDFLMTKKGPTIIEVNFTPGFIVKYFKHQIAAIVLKYIYNRTAESLGLKEELREEVTKQAKQKSNEQKKTTKSKT